jgi:hypothetical protein
MWMILRFFHCFDMCKSFLELPVEVTNLSAVQVSCNELFADSCSWWSLLWSKCLARTSFLTIVFLYPTKLSYGSRYQRGTVFRCSVSVRCYYPTPRQAGHGSPNSRLRPRTDWRPRQSEKDNWSSESTLDPVGHLTDSFICTRSFRNVTSL